MNLAQFYSMIQFSAQKPGKQTTKTTVAKEPATTTTTVAATAAPVATTNIAAITTTALATSTTTTTTNLFPPTIMTAATAAVGYSNGIFYLPHDAISNNKNNNNSKNDDDYEDEEDVANDEETDSLASLETLSDNVSIWVDGEKHWVSGVDANTTCTDLINALLNYQDDQQLCSNSNSNSSNNKLGNNTINQSTLNTKEAEPVAVPAAEQLTSKKPQPHTDECNLGARQLTSTSTGTSNGTSTTTTYVIVKQHRHCEQFLDGSTKVFDVLPAASGREEAASRKEHQLFLRRLTHSAHINSTSAAPVLGSLLSTDKDSGMGSPVGSSRSARLRRKKHKSTISWLAQGNTLHPKLSQRGSAANERLMKIILAQDETIHRQLTLLREKERQISKIEEENHRTRERELGKNYLLETYLNGLDEAVTGTELVEGEEIFIDEPLLGYTATTTIKQQHQQQQKHQHERKHKHHKQRSTKHSKTSHKTATMTNATTTITADVATAHPDAAAAAADNKKDLELQILWMEKMYSINKQLQKEEELLLKLHSKIRKHHVRRAQHNKQQLLQQIDDLDSNLALQSDDIHSNEANLLTTDEQLQQKLDVLERLQQQLDVNVLVEDEQQTTEQLDAQMTNGVHKRTELMTPATRSGETIATLTTPAATTMTALTTSSSSTKLTLHAMQSPADLLSLQQLIAKPQTAAVAVTATSTLTSTAGTSSPTANAVHTPANYQLIKHATNAPKTDSEVNEQQSLSQQQQLTTVLLHPPPPPQQHLNDKLHALHMKTVKKQMFGPKAVVNPPLISATATTQSAPSPAAIATTTTIVARPPPLLLLPADTLDFTQIGTLV